MLVAQNTKSNYENMTILCVDDEINMLRALQRVFHQKPYRVLLADSAKKALILVEKHSVNLIISDMRMPQMNGVEFLQEVAMINPDIHRIILSGYADFESTVAAINIGKINNFINKPWNNEELINVVEEGLSRVLLKQDNIRLNSLVKEQNEQLIKWNNDLESKVNLRTKQIRNALRINERNIKSSEKMLINFISINPHLSGDFSRCVSNLASKLAINLNFDKKVINEIRLAGELVEIGMLSIDPLICTTPFNDLNDAQREEFLRQVITAEEILSPAIHLKNVMDIISNQYKTISEITLDEPLRTSVKVIIIARDYWRLATGRIIHEKLDHKRIKAELTKGKNIYYDEDIIDILLANDELINEENILQGISSNQIEAGMILKNSLYTAEHLLILAEGHEFSEMSIERLIQYEKNKKCTFSIVIEI